MFIKKKTIYGFFLFVIILVLGSFLRLYKLDKIPNGFYVDEAAQGYNAYSILTTGKDEYGKSYPLLLRSFGTYPPALYAYLTTIPIKLTGFNIWSVRIVSALSGIALIPFFFLILKKLNLFKSEFTPYIGTFLFTISPWGIFASRGILEPNPGFLLLTISVYLFLLAREHPQLLPPAVIPLALSTYAYPTQRLIAPILLVGTIFLLHKKRNLNTFTKKEVITCLALFLLLLTPLISLTNTPAFTNRSSNLFYANVIKEQAAKIPLPHIISYPLAFTREFSSQFTTYFSPYSLFFKPDPDKQRSAPELSVFYSWMIIPYTIGLFTILQRIKKYNMQFVLLMALIFAAIPALTGNPFSTLRALNLLLPLTIIISLGTDTLLTTSQKKLWIAFGFLAIPVSLLLLWRSYFILLPAERAAIWGYGFRQLAEITQTNQNKKFLIDQSRIKPAYIEMAFFLKYPPEKLQQSVDPKIKDNYYQNIEFNPNYQINNIEIRAIKWEEDIYEEQILVGDKLAVSPNQAKEHSLTKIFEIKDPTNNIIFQGFKTNPKTKCYNNKNQSPLCINEQNKNSRLPDLPTPPLLNINSTPRSKGTSKRDRPVHKYS